MAGRKKEKKKEIMRIERESVIMTMKPKLIMGLAEDIELDTDREEFLVLCKRIDATIRAWYHPEFEELMQLYSLFDPISGAKKLEQQRLSPERVDFLEQQFLKHLFKIMRKSNYKLLSDDEVEIANMGQYLLNLPIAVDTSKLDSKLFSKFFDENPMDYLPAFAKQYVLFRQGIGFDQTTGFFFSEKIDSLIGRIWDYFLSKTRLRKLFSKKESTHRSSSMKRILDSIPDQNATDKEKDLYVERIRIQNLELSVKNFMSKTTVQEPTFERMILVYRRATPRNDKSKYGDRAIHIKQFRHIPMADMELVLPEKKNPGLTPMDWTKLMVSAGIGLVTLLTSLEMPKADFWVVMAILGAIVGYCVKIFLSFQQSLIQYQNLITRSMYDKQLDSGKGTLLHMCDDVIQQEVKEVILAYFVLISQGKATKEDREYLESLIGQAKAIHHSFYVGINRNIQDLDFRCETLMIEEFEEKCDFEVEDAIQKMKRLGLVTRDSVGRYSHIPLKRANEILGQTTEEKVAQVLG